MGWALGAAREMSMGQIESSLDLLNRNDGKKKKFVFVGREREEMKFVWASGECAICILAMAKLAKLAGSHKLVTYSHKVV